MSLICKHMLIVKIIVNDKLIITPVGLFCGTYEPHDFMNCFKLEFLEEDTSRRRFDCKNTKNDLYED